MLENDKYVFLQRLEMDKKNSNQLNEITQRTKRNNIYTNHGLHDGNQNLKCFSSNRPLSAEQPYQQIRRSPHTYLRSKQKSQKSPKPMRIGKFNHPPEENTNIYFDQKQYEEKVKSLTKPNTSHSRSSDRNIYISKNINTSYGRGNFRGNYQNLFMEYQYQGEQKSKQNQPKKDFYTKYKTKTPFKPSGNVLKTVGDQNEPYQKKSDPYKPVNEQYMFRAKSPTNKFLNRYQWKPTTQFSKKNQQ